MSQEWNKLAGELRSALAARDWRQAGAIAWQLRQLDGERFTLELEHYTNEQVRKGGYGMALETEQRLEAVREMARTSWEFFSRDEFVHSVWHATLEGISKSYRIDDESRNFNETLQGRSFFDTLGYRHLRMSEQGILGFEHATPSGLVVSFDCLDFSPDKSLRADMRDVLWFFIRNQVEARQPKV